MICFQKQIASQSSLTNSTWQFICLQLVPLRCRTHYCSSVQNESSSGTEDILPYVYLYRVCLSHLECIFMLCNFQLSQCISMINHVSKLVFLMINAVMRINMLSGVSSSWNVVEKAEIWGWHEKNRTCEQQCCRCGAVIGSFRPFPFPMIVPMIVPIRKPTMKKMLVLED